MNDEQRERRRQQRREAYARNRDKELAQNREWCAENKTRRAEYMKPYLAEYYRKNRKQIRQQMVDKYKSDPEFRKQVLADSKARNAKVKAGHIPKPLQLHRNIGGKSERLYRTSEGAREVGCNGVSFLNWHRQGWIPVPMIVDGRRLYTQEKLDLIALFYSVNCHDFEKRSEISTYIIEQWSP